MTTTITGVSFDLGGTFTEFGVFADPDGADQWLITEGDDGEVYAVWGDGKGWNIGSTYQAMGITKITGTPAGLSGTEVYGAGDVNRKPLGFVADQSSVMKLFITKDTDTWDGSYGGSSTDRGASWAYEGTATYSFATDAVRVVGIAQFDAGYSNVPAGIDPAYYYIYLSARGVEESGDGPDIFLARCLKADIFTRANHEYYSGTGPTWTPTFANKIAVLHDAQGMQYHFQPVWCPGLSRFIGSKGQPLGQLGLYDAPAPWGPWHQIYHAQIRDALVKFTYNTPQKWMSGDGLTFWLTWSGYPEYDHISIVQGTFTISVTQDSTPPLGMTY